MDGFGWIFFWLIINAVIGGLIGSTRNNVGSGVVWGLLLGPIGWLLVLLLDRRPKCPECCAPMAVDARRCQKCGYDTVSKTNPQRPAPVFQEANVPPPVPVLNKKKCPFCAELIQPEAIKCRYCGSDLAGQPVPAGSPPIEQSPEASGTAVAKSVQLSSSMVTLPPGSRLPCPKCSQNVKVSDLKIGENFCPHCFESFTVE